MAVGQGRSAVEDVNRAGLTCRRAAWRPDPAATDVSTPTIPISQQTAAAGDDNVPMLSPVRIVRPQGPSLPPINRRVVIFTKKTMTTTSTSS